MTSAELFLILEKMTISAWLGGLVFIVVMPLENPEVEDFFSRKYLPAGVLLTLATVAFWLFGR